MERKYIILVLSIAIIVIARLIPSILFEQLYSTDSWPLLYDVKVLEENPDAQIFNDKLFDGYNNHWPLVIVFTRIVSLMTSLNSKEALKIYIPLVNGLGSLILMVLFKKITGKDTCSYILPLILLMMPSLLVFTSAATKETFAHPLFYLILFLGLLNGNGIDKKTVLLIAIASISLVFSHHLTTMILAVTITITATYTRLRRILLGEFMRNYPVSAIIIVFIPALIHAIVIGGNVLLSIVALHDIFDLFLYILFFASLFSILLRWKSDDINFKGKGFLLSIGLTLMIMWIILASTRSSIIYGIQPMGLDVLFYSLPLIPAPMLIYIGLKKLSRNGKHVYVLSLLSSIIGIALYFAIGNPLATSILHRVINFLLIPVSMAYASILMSGKRVFKVSALLIVVLILTAAFITEYRLFTGEDNISYYWIYRSSEYYAMEYVLSHAGIDKIEIVGDSKVYYLGQAFNISVDTTSIGDLFKGKVSNRTYYFYKDNFVKGFVISLSIIKPDLDTKALLYRNNLLYNSIEVVLIRGT